MAYAITLPLSRCHIPGPWAQQVRDRISAILGAERTQLAFAQLFDGSQTEIAALMMGEIPVSVLLAKVTTTAQEAATSWLADQAARIEERHLNAAVANEIAQILSSELQDLYKIQALLLGLIRPMIRDCVQDFCMQRGKDGHPISGEGFQQHWRGKGMSAIEAILDWSEEYIFGGQLCKGGANKLRIAPFHHMEFEITYEHAWKMTDLPIQDPAYDNPALFRSSVPQLTDDVALYQWCIERERNSL